MESPGTLLNRVRAPRAAGGLRGFTLIEMMVVVIIMLVLTAVTVLGQTSFNRSILLTNTAYTIALSVRQAQSLGLSSRQYISGGTSYQNAGYGIYLSRLGSSVAARSYIVFADIGGNQSQALATNCAPLALTDPEWKPGDCRYTPPGTGADGILQTYRLERGFYVSRFCGIRTSNGSLACSNTGTSSTWLSDLNIVFRRPNTQTILTGTIGGQPRELSTAAIYVSSPDGTTERGICISSVGQVSVILSGNCP